MNKTVRRGVHLLIMMVTLLTICCGATFIASAEVDDTFTVDDLIYRVTAEDDESKKVEVAGYQDGYDSDLIIPSTVTNNEIEYVVTSIGEKTFDKCFNLESVTIGDSVTEIGNSAFSCCFDLTSVTIGNSVTEIGNSAFSCCFDLTSVTIPDSVTSIGEEAFYGCDKLSTVYSYATSAPSLGSRAFERCHLEKIYIPCGTKDTKDTYVDAGWPKDQLQDTLLVVSGTVTNEEGCRMENANVALSYKSGGQTKTESINTNSEGYYEFVKEDAESGEYTIEVKKDGYMDFSITSNTSKCDVKLEKEVTFTVDYLTYKATAKGNINTVEVVGYQDGYDSDLIIPSTVINNETVYEVTSIGEKAFYECWIKSVEIPDSVTSIEYRAFFDCQALTSITIPDSVTSIGESVFVHCISLKSITIPDSVTSIGNAALYNTRISTVYSYATSAPSLGSDAFGLNGHLKKIYIPCGTKGAYVDAGWPKNKLQDTLLVVSGTVTNEEGCRMENANVTLSYKSGGQTKTKSTNTNSEGYYEFVVEDANSSEYTIEVKKDKYIDYSITTDTPKCDVELKVYTYIRGRLRDNQSGAYISGAEVTLYDDSGTKIDSCMTDNVGRFNFLKTLLSNGSYYIIEIKKEGYKTITDKIDIESKSSGPLDLEYFLEQEA